MDLFCCYWNKTKWNPLENHRANEKMSKVRLVKLFLGSALLKYWKSSRGLSLGVRLGLKTKKRNRGCVLGGRSCGCWLALKKYDWNDIKFMSRTLTEIFSFFLMFKMADRYFTTFLALKKNFASQPSKHRASSPQSKIQTLRERFQ